MRSHLLSFLLIIVCAINIIGCSSSGKITGKQPQSSISQLRFINEYDLPDALQFKGTTVGGLSGIDYDFKRDVYYMIADDRSAINPARYYTAKIHLKETGIDSVEFFEVNTLLNKESKPYPNSSENPLHTPDPEAIRYNPKKDELVWSSEGERFIRPGTTVLEDPAVTIINRDGFYKDSFALPANMHMSAEEKGPRQNGVFEGMTFANNYKHLYISVEESLYEDGSRASTGDTSALIRIIKYNAATRHQLAQYAYKVDPIQRPSVPASAFKINGVPDILYIGNNKLLVIERAFSTGRLACTIRVFIADLDKAEDVSAINSLPSVKNLKLAHKKLLLDMDDLGRYVDNVEGVTFGPKLPNGHNTLIFVVDNNFSKLEKMQFFLFEVIP
jgi:hypothetical protein